MVRPIGRGTGLLLVALMVLGVPSAAADQFSVEEVLGSANTATATFQAAAGEDNDLTIGIAGQGQGFYQLRVVDDGAPLSAGAGCTGGGSPGSVVSCKMHEPKGADTEPCHFPAGALTG